MSQIAGFYVMPESAIPDLRKSAVPQKAGWFGQGDRQIPADAARLFRR